MVNNKVNAKPRIGYSVHREVLLGTDVFCHSYTNEEASKDGAASHKGSSA